MIENKKHWYDGLFYDLIIAPNQDRLFKQIKELIEPDSKIIDVGCGTGRFSFTVADKCKSVLGIDLSKQNIERANHNLANDSNRKILFQHKNISEIISEGKDHFDYAILTYVIHEVDENERIKLLNDISAIADKVIIGDYCTPVSNGFWDLLNEIVEFAAGRQHYKNFKSYIKNKGINGIVAKSGLSIVREIRNTPLTSHIAVISRIE